MTTPVDRRARALAAIADLRRLTLPEPAGTYLRRSLDLHTATLNRHVPSRAQFAQDGTPLCSCGELTLRAEDGVEQLLPAAFPCRDAAPVLDTYAG